MTKLSSSLPAMSRIVLHARFVSRRWCNGLLTLLAIKTSFESFSTPKRVVDVLRLDGEGTEGVSDAVPMRQVDIEGRLSQLPDRLPDALGGGPDGRRRLLVVAHR